MRFSFETVRDNLNLTRGYGVAGYRVIRSLQSLGHTVPFDDAETPIQMSFNPPQYYKFNPGQYRIGYTPWESTELPNGWLEKMNECDEVWATSPWVAEVYKNSGVKPPIHVYEHGIDNKWAPMRRTGSDVVRYLHVGEPALRKGGQMALDAFRAAFGNRTDVHLTLKCYEDHWLRAWHNGQFTTPDKAYDNVTIITKTIPEEELMALYRQHDVMVYPTYGEGFGFLPLQSLATGMPTICTDEWAPYREFLGPLALRGRWDRSVWSVHPGDVYYPDYDMLVDLYKFSFDNLEYLRNYYEKQSPDIHATYNWVRQTEKAFEHIFERFTEN